MSTPFFLRRHTTPCLLAALLSTSTFAADPPPTPPPGPYPWPKATKPADATTIDIPAHFKGSSAKRPSSGNGHTETVATISWRNPIGSSWWELFHDPTLSGLERDAIASNQDLRQALERVTEAQQQTRATAADFFPRVDARFEASRQRTTDTGPILSARLPGSTASLFGAAAGQSGGPSTFQSQAVSTTYNDFHAPLTLSYEVDVFGRIRHSYGQARADAQASDADRRAVELRLTSELATDYFLLRALDSQVEVLQRTLDLRNKGVQLQQKRLDAGNASKLDLWRAQVERDNTAATLNDAVRQRAEMENTVAALCGRAASNFHVAPHPLTDTAPPAIPTALPADLLTQRPDLVEAERRLAAASEGIGAARAGFFPTFNLQGNYGYESAEFDHMFEERSRAWGISGVISVPIFEGGRNTANLRAAHARRDEAFAAYQQAALTAFKEAETALVDLRQRVEQSDIRERAVTTLRLVVDASQQRYIEGAVTYFEVIDAQRLVLDAELSRVQTLNARYAATIDLIRAFGGRYEKAVTGSLRRDSK